MWLLYWVGTSVGTIWAYLLLGRELFSFESYDVEYLEVKRVIYGIVLSILSLAELGLVSAV